MKKLSFTIIVSILFAINTIAQMPNCDFENWTSNIIAKPDGWQTYGRINQITPGVSGNFAIRIERDSLYTNAPGAILFGTPQGNGVSGGIPFVAHPDSLIGFFKYNIKTGDSAWVLIILKSKGIPISSDTGFFTGTDTAKFNRIAFKIHYVSDKASDSLILAITSTNPDNQVNGSYVMVDSLHFTNTALVLPNGGFEKWDMDTVEEPNNWYTSNNYYLSNPNLPVTKTTDSHSGTYAIRIENVNTKSGLANAFAFAGPQGNNGPKPGFAVTERNLFFEGYYKFYPKNNDTLMIGVIMYDRGSQVGWGVLRSNTPKSSYTYFATPIYYNYNFIGIPDSATIILMPYAGGPFPRGNSVLYADSIGFNNQIKLDQTIIFGALPPKSIDDQLFDLTAYSSSGYPVSYMSSNTVVAIIGGNGNTVILMEPGTTEITAYIDANDYFNPATPITQTLTVLPKTGIGEVSSEMLKIYPNSTTGIVNIQSTKLMNYISVYNLQGTMMNQYKLNSINGSIDISQLSNGLYFIKVQCGETEYVKKIEKK